MTAEVPTSRQNTELDILRSLVNSAHLPSVLLIGPHGAGKKRLANWLATGIGLPIRSVQMSWPPNEIYKRLFGGGRKGKKELKPRHETGYASEQEPHFLLLSDLDRLDPDSELTDALYDLVKHRTYYDAIGAKHRINDQSMIVATLSTNRRGASITQDHWLISAFLRQKVICATWDGDDLQIIAGTMLRRAGSNAGVSLDSDFLRQLVGTFDDGLWDLDRVLKYSLDLVGPDVKITRTEIHNALADLLLTKSLKITYRGSDLTRDLVVKWQKQFSSGLQLSASRLLSHIAQRYYISETECWNLLEGLARDSRIPIGDRVVFCKWQSLGKSSPMLSYKLGKTAGWKIAGDLDLDSDPINWPLRFGGSVDNFVMIDDFVGSGGTVVKSSLIVKDRLNTLLSRYNPSAVVFIALVGYLDGIRNIRETLAPFGSRTRLLIGKAYDGKDKCFSEQSLTLPDRTERALMREECLRIAEKHFNKLPRRDWLGYKGGEALCVLPDTIPNNSLPQLWYTEDDCDWIPLFPREGRMSS
jgi:hypothetical protein